MVVKTSQLNNQPPVDKHHTSDVNTVVQSRQQFKDTKIEVQIAAQAWAEFYYKEYSRDKDIVIRTKKLGSTATTKSSVNTGGYYVSSNSDVSGIDKKPTRK